MKEKPKSPFQREMDNDPLNEKSDDITVPGYTGTWYVIDQTSEFGPPLFLLESEQDGDESACLIVDKWGNPVWDGAYNGWDDLEEAKASLDVMFVNHYDTVLKKQEWRIYRDIGWRGAFG